MLNVALNNDYDGDFYFSCPIRHTQSQCIDKVVCSHKANDKDMCWPPRIVHPNGAYFTISPKQDKHRLTTKEPLSVKAQALDPW